MAISGSTGSGGYGQRAIDQNSMSARPQDAPTSQIDHGHGVPPAPTVPVPSHLSGPLVPNSSVQPTIVQAHGRGVFLAPQAPPRAPLAPVILDDRARTGLTIGASVPTQTVTGLDDAQYERLARLLDVEPEKWVSSEVSRTTHGMRLKCTLPDPLALRNLMRLSSMVEDSNIRVDFEIEQQASGRQIVRSIELKDANGNTTTLPARSIDFNAPGLPQCALVPADILDRPGVQRLLTTPFRQMLNSVRNDDGSLQVTYRTGLGAHRTLSVRLCSEPLLGGWRVAQVGTSVAARLPQQLQPDCREWLQRGVRSPQLPASLIDTLEHALTQHANGAPPAVGVRIFESDTSAPQTMRPPYVEYTGLVPLGEGNTGFENWQARVLFADCDRVAIAAAVRFRNPQLEAIDHGTVYRPDTVDWTNPLAPRGGTLDSVSSTAGRRTAEEAGLSPLLAPLAPSMRGWNNASNDEATQAVLSGPSPSQTTIPMDAGAVAAAFPWFQTQQEYLALQGPGCTHSAVCPALAAGVALGRYVPFNHLQAVNPNAQLGTSATQVEQLLQQYGAVTTRHAFFQATNGGRSTVQIGGQLQAMMDRGTFNSAVLLYRGRADDGLGRPDGELHHHVALFRHASANGWEWSMHDGARQKLPWPVDGAQAAAYTYGARRDDGFGELEMVVFMRPLIPANPMSGNPIVMPAAVPTPQWRGELDLPTVPHVQNGGDPLRGRQLTASQASQRNLWNQINATTAGAMMVAAMDAHNLLLSHPQKVDLLLAACTAHRGEITPDNSGTPEEPVYAYKGIDVQGVTGDVYLRFSSLAAGRSARVTGVRIHSPGTHHELVWQKTTPRGARFVMALGSISNQLSRGERREVLNRTGTLSRWERTRTNDRELIATAIVKACADGLSRSQATEQDEDTANQIISVQVRFCGANEKFFLRFLDDAREEVVDVRVRDTTEAENDVVEKMRSSMRRGQDARENRHRGGRSINQRDVGSEPGP